MATQPRQHDTKPSHDSHLEPGQSPHERPEMWGWHAESGRGARVGGIVVIAALLLMITTTSYNGAGTVALVVMAAVLALALVWDHHRRKTSWRR